jgi:hypothetical protein
MSRKQGPVDTVKQESEMLMEAQTCSAARIVSLPTSGPASTITLQHPKAAHTPAYSELTYNSLPSKQVSTVPHPNAKFISQRIPEMSVAMCERQHYV